MSEELRQSQPPPDDGIDADVFLEQQLKTFDDSRNGKSSSTVEGKDTSPNETSERAADDNGNKESATGPKDLESDLNKPTKTSDVTTSVLKNEQPESRANKRIRESVEQANLAKAEAKRYKEELDKLKSNSTQTQKPTEEKVIVPAPTKPQFTLEQLAVEKQKARANGDEAMLDFINEEIDKVKQYNVDVKLWKFENGQAIAAQSHNEKYYESEALKKWPELANPDSDITKTYNNLSPHYPEILSRKSADGKYVLANVANMLVKNKSLEAENVALKSEKEQLLKQTKTLNGKLSPARQVESVSTGDQSNNDDPDQWLTDQIKARGFAVR